MITTRLIKSFQGILLAFSIVASFLVFQENATACNDYKQRVRTEWVSIQKTQKRTVAYRISTNYTKAGGRPINRHLAELIYSAQIKATLDNTSQPNRAHTLLLYRKIPAGASDADPDDLI